MPTPFWIGFWVVLALMLLGAITGPTPQQRRERQVRDTRRRMAEKLGVSESDIEL